MAATAKLVAAFMKRQGDALKTAADLALNQAAQDTKKMALGQLKSRFRKQAGQISIKKFPERGDLPAAIFVTIRPGFLSVFETGGTVSASRYGYLIVPLNGQKRIGKGGWDKRFAELKQAGKVAIIPRPGGYTVLLNGKPAYAFQKSSTLKQRTDIGKQAKEIGGRMGETIEQLLKAKL